jgi:putative colanic acid biosynthesis UDP-glucose lipid carrier transferase
MFEDRTYKRTFYSAPQSVTSFVAAFLEPSITVLTFLIATLYADELIDRPALTLCLLVFALTFPGRNRFRDNLIAAGVDILSSWVMLLGILALCGYATRSLHYFENSVLLNWAVVTPVLQWFAVWIGKLIVQRLSARPEARRSAIIVGGGALGVKVAKALTESADYGVDFVGFFDDRTDDRLHEEASVKRLGGLKDVAAYATEHNVREVYITLPLGSQPRIVELLEEVQGTTASLFFVPDVFGISIIQGRLQDMNGVPVVGICETPFTGTNELVKRISDVVIGSIILILISPILLAIAIGVKLSSPGPAIYKQRRNGLDGGEIVVYKVRSMRSQDNGPVVRQAT